MFVSNHSKPFFRCYFHTNSKNLPYTELVAETILNNLGRKKPINWIDRLNAEAFPDSALNTSKVRPLSIEHHPVKQLNIILRKAIASLNLETIQTILTEIESESFKEHVLANTLPLAVENESIEIVKLLIRYGASVNARYENIKSEWIFRDVILDDYEEGREPFPLLIAVIRNNLELVKTLIENNADVNLTADLMKKTHQQYIFNSDITPLHYAASIGNPEIIKFLIENEANVNAWNGFHETPLSMAAEKGHVKSIEILLKNGADPKQRNQWGLYPYDLAKSQEVLNLLNQE